MGPSSVVFEEFLVCSGALQVDRVRSGGVYQNPVRLNVSVALSGPVEFQRVIFVLWRQRLPSEQKLDQLFQLLGVFAPLLESLHIAIKLA